MKQRIKSALLAILIALTGSLVMVPAIANAGFKTDACEGVGSLSGTASAPTVMRTPVTRLGSL